MNSLISQKRGSRPSFLKVFVRRGNFPSFRDQLFSKLAALLVPGSKELGTCRISDTVQWAYFWNISPCSQAILLDGTYVS